MGWYKKSSEVQMTETVKKWLIQAYKGAPDLRLIDADLDQFTPAITDEQSIDMGAVMAQNQLHLSELTTIQQGILDHIKSRVTSRQQKTEPGQINTVNAPENEMENAPADNGSRIEQSTVQQTTI